MNWEENSFLGQKLGKWYDPKIKYANAFFERSETQRDSNGNVTMESELTKLKIQREPGFIKLYLDDIAYLSNIPKTCSDVVYELLKLMSYEGDIYIHSDQKLAIAEKLKLKIDAVNKAIGDLNKAQVIIRVTRGHYQANPFLFGKGEWKDIQQIRVSLIYSDNSSSVCINKGDMVFKESTESKTGT